MKVKVVNSAGKETGKEVTLPKGVFGVEPNDHAIYLDVKQYLANQRQGTHSSKSKGEVTASTRKIKKQKGTGTARAGSLKSGVFVGGGRIHGPKPRDYSFKLNKKLKVVARRSAFSYKAIEKEIVVVDALAFDEAKSKNYVAFLNGLDVAGKKTLLLSAENNTNAYLSARNIPGAQVKLATDATTYEILNAKCLIVEEGALDKLKETLN